MSKRNIKLTDDEIQKKIDNVHGKGEFKLVKGSYINYNEKFEVIHKCGGIWKSYMVYITDKNKGCPTCRNKERHLNRSKNFNEKIQRIYKGEFDIVSPYIKLTKDVTVTHNKCGFKKSMLAQTIVRGNYRCPICNPSRKKNESIGERKIRQYLEKHNIKYAQELSLDGLKFERDLRFDFALLSGSNVWGVIEFDGAQHFLSPYIEDELGYYDYNYIKERDDLKEGYCTNNGIKLMRIPYTHLGFIDNVLDRYFKAYMYLAEIA